MEKETKNTPEDKVTRKNGFYMVKIRFYKDQDSEPVDKWSVALWNGSDFEELNNIYREDEVLAVREIEIQTALNERNSLQTELSEMKKEREELMKWIASDSVYTLLRYGTKSPSHSGVDDCEDDHYSDLYNLSTELRIKK